MKGRSCHAKKKREVCSYLPMDETDSSINHPQNTPIGARRYEQARGIRNLKGDSSLHNVILPIHHRVFGMLIKRCNLHHLVQKIIPGCTNSSSRKETRSLSKNHSLACANA
jgi:hypothetical protein